MELSAIIDGLEYMKENHKDFYCEVFTDSAYIFNCYNKNGMQVGKKMDGKILKKSQ